MDAQTILPKRVVNYIHDVGVRALDHLADNVEPAAGPGPTALHTLVDHWKSMPKEDKEQFVDRVAASVIEVVAASTLIPAGLKLGKKAAKSARKAIKRHSKTLKKSAKEVARGKGKVTSKRKKA